MRLSGEMITTLADFSDGEECIVNGPTRVLMGGEILSVITAKRVEDQERVRIFETGQIERVTDNG